MRIQVLGIAFLIWPLSASASIFQSAVRLCGDITIAVRPSGEKVATILVEADKDPIDLGFTNASIKDRLSQLQPNETVYGCASGSRLPRTYHGVTTFSTESLTINTSKGPETGFSVGNGQKLLPGFEDAR